MTSYWSLSLTDDDLMGEQAARANGLLPPEPPQAPFPETMAALNIDAWEPVGPLGSGPLPYTQPLTGGTATAVAAPAPQYTPLPPPAPVYQPPPPTYTAPATGTTASAEVVANPYQQLTRTTPQYTQPMVEPDRRSPLEKAASLLKDFAPPTSALMQNPATALIPGVAALEPVITQPTKPLVPAADPYVGGAYNALNDAIAKGFNPGAALGGTALGPLAQSAYNVLPQRTREAVGTQIAPWVNPLPADTSPLQLATTLPDLFTYGAGIAGVKAAGNLAQEGAERYVANAARAGLGAVPEGAALRTIAPAAPINVPGSIPRGISPTEGLGIMRTAGAAEKTPKKPLVGQDLGAIYQEGNRLLKGSPQGDRVRITNWQTGERFALTPTGQLEAIEGALQGYATPQWITRPATVAEEAALQRAADSGFVQMEHGSRFLSEDGSLGWRTIVDAKPSLPPPDYNRVADTLWRAAEDEGAGNAAAVYGSREQLIKQLQADYAARSGRVAPPVAETTTAPRPRPSQPTPRASVPEASPAGLTDQAAAPPSGSPPSGAGAGGAGGNDPVRKLVDVIDQARPLPAQTEAVRSAERAQRVAASASILERGGRTPEAYQAARGALGGEYSRAAFDPPAANFAPEEVEALRSKLAEAGLRHFEEINAEQALGKVLDGRLNEIRNFELELLDRVYGSDLSLAVAAKAMPASFGDKAYEFWLANVLSGPITHARNFVGNAASALASPIERFGAAALEQPVSRIQGRAAERFFAEVPAEVFGMVRGVPTGVNGALRTIKNGWGQSALTEAARAPAIGGKLGRVIRTPLTAMEAMDAFFRAINFEGAKSALAVRTAKMQGLKGEALNGRIAELIANPSDDIIDQATKAAAYRLFRDDPTKYGHAVMAAREKAPALRFILPFVRTPDRLIAYGIRRSPLGLLDYPMWQRLAAKNPGAVDELAQTLMGSAVALGLASQVATGSIDIVGAPPTDPAERDRFYREGKLPFSVKLPGIGWIQYSQIPGLDTTLSTLAAAKQALQDGGDVDMIAAQLGATVAQNIFDKSYVSGLADFMDIFQGGFTDPVEATQRWAARNVAGFVPASGAIRQTSQMFDRTIGDAETFQEQVGTSIGIPGAAPPRLTAFGEESKRAFPSPISASPDRQSAVDAELARLGEEVTFVGTSIGGRKLSREEQFDYQKLAGTMTYVLLEEMINMAGWSDLSDEEKQSAIDDAKDSARDWTRDYLKDNNYRIPAGAAAR